MVVGKDGNMIRACGRVVGGHLRVDIPVDLTDNTEMDQTVVPETELDDEDDRLLAETIEESRAEIARGEPGRSPEEVVERLRARSRDEALSGTPADQG